MTMRKIKQIGAFLFALTAMVAYVFSEKNAEPEVLVSKPSGNSVEIVLLDKDLDCVPFTIKSTAEDLQGQLQDIIASMCTDKSILQGFTGLFPPGTELLSADLQTNELTLDFNASLKQVDAALELKALEAMSYVFTQFEGVETIRILVDGEPLEHFEAGNIQIDQPLSKSLALNNFDTVNSKLHKTTGFMAAVSKQNGTDEYLTLKCIRSSDPLITSIENYYTRRDSILIDGHVQYKSFSLSQSEDVLTLSISAEILTPQKTCDAALIDPILMTLKANFDVDVICVVVEGVEVIRVKTAELKFNQI